MAAQQSGMSRRAFGAGLGGVALTGCGASETDYARAARGLRRPLDPSAPDPIAELVRYATLAANGHNTQPWRFARTAGGVDVLPDMTRRTPIVDPDDHHLYVSLGAAAENLLIGAPTLKRAGELRVAPGGARLFMDLQPTAIAEDPLAAAIPKRQCTRAFYDGRTPSTDEIAQLVRIAQSETVEVRILTSRRDIDAVRDFVVEGNRSQMADPAFMKELKHWLRFNPEAAIKAGDGLYAASSGNPTLPGWIADVMFKIAFTPEAETDKYITQMNSSAGVAVLIGAGAAPENWIEVGRAYQRLALQATLLGLKHAFVNQPVEVEKIRSQLSDYLGLKGRRPDLALRFGYGPELPFSLRRPVRAVLSADTP